jgi:hypothetical protein
VLAWRLRRQCLDRRASRDEALGVIAKICGLHTQVMSSAELTLWARLEGIETPPRYAKAELHAVLSGSRLEGRCLLTPELAVGNLTASGAARLAVGPTRDVVMIDAVLEKAIDVGADDALGAAYVARADWDPRRSAGYVFFVLRPVRVQAWREANEITGRTLMRDGNWLD